MVYLGKMKVKRNGKDYIYWNLQWTDSNNRNHCKTIGSVKKTSKRQAEKIRTMKEVELTNHPGRRNSSKAPLLRDYLETYLRNRKNELAPGTYQLHEQTKRYLLGHFGDCRRLDNIQRPDARAFKAALADGSLTHVNTRNTQPMKEATVHLHIRNARTMFAHALVDDIIPYNPFDKIAGAAPVPKAWHEVTDDEMERLLSMARPEWKLLLGLCRYAGLRRGEALNLRWENIDWERSRLTVIASDEWQPKDKQCRVVPIAPQLREILSGAFDEGWRLRKTVIAPGMILIQNISRDFDVLCKRAGVQRYHKPLHTLRKTCFNVWARQFPEHVVAAWGGHADSKTTREFYLQVSESEYKLAAGIEENENKKSGVYNKIYNKTAG